jgi:amidase
MAALILLGACSQADDRPSNGLGKSVPLSPPGPGPQYAVYEASIPTLQEAMEEGRVTSQQLVQAYLHRIAAYDNAGPALNTIMRLNPLALSQAAALDSERVAKGPRGPLHGIPILLKDNYDSQELPASAGSVSLANASPVQDGFVVARLRAAGAVILGTTNMMEFAMGITTNSSLGGQTRNPYDPARYPGGSSGGSAAAVSASFAAVSWGTDTCGSIRVPAAFNALFGLRPTKGITSVTGIIPFCPSQDVSGPLARTMTDLAIALDVTVALDPLDPASAKWRGQPLPRFVASLDSNALRGARLGMVKQLFGHGLLSQEVSDTVRAAVARMRAAGAIVQELSLPDLETQALAASTITFEARDAINKYLSSRTGSPVDSVGEIMTRGLFLSELAGDLAMLNASPDTSSPGFAAAMAKRVAFQATLQQLLTTNKLDALVYPTVRYEPMLIGNPQDDPNCEISANSGYPALSVPVGFTQRGLPVAMELLGRPLTDARLVAIGYAWERLASPRRPPLFTPQLHDVTAPEPAIFKVVLKKDSMQATVRFIFDAATGKLDYDVAVTGINASDLLAVSLHQPPVGKVNGPVILRLAAPGQLKKQSSAVLLPLSRLALHNGLLYVSVITRQDPLGTVRGNVPAPNTPPIGPIS